MSKLTKTGKRCIIRLTELEELVVSLSIPGSARHSHCRGQGFDSPMLHKEISHPLRVADFFMRTRGVRIPDFDIALNALERESRRRPPEEGVSSAAFSPETSDLRSAESRRLRARTRGSTPKIERKEPSLRSRN